MLTAWLALGAIPQMPKVIHAFGYYPTRTAAGLAEPPLHPALSAMSATVATRPRVPAVLAQLVRFGLVGADNTALTLATYAVLSPSTLPVALAGAVGWGVGARQRLPPQPRVDLPRRRARRHPAARYAVVALMGSGLNAALVAIAVAEQHLPRIAGELAVLPPVTLLTFVLCRGWVFAPAVPA